MLKKIKRVLKIEIFVSILVLLILLNYFIMFISYNEYVIKLIFSLYIFTILVFFVYKPLNFFHLKITLIILMIIVLGNPTYSWDAWTIWLFHAKRIFFEQSIIAQLDGYAMWTHNDYPVIAPTFAASLATLVGGWNNIFPKLAFLLMFFPPLILSIKIFNVRYHLLFLILTLFILNLYLINGLVDGLVAIYFSFSSYLVYDIFVNKQNSFYYLFITFCFFIILSLLKNEGIVMVTILLSIIIIINISKKEILQNYKKIFFLLFSLIPVLIWKINCINHNIKNDYINYDMLNILTDRIFDYNSFKLIFKFLILDTKFILSIIFILIAFNFTKNKKIFYFSLLVGMSYIFSLFMVYLMTPFDLTWQLSSSASRIIMSPVFLFSFFGLLQIYCMKEKISQKIFQMK
ncbi:MAG: hypothetical protein QGF61_04540 [Pelagibacteraceae bacterium]|jgi:hypothetical protein|nr:hypothetical protein [Pelagibacteraceae bacterium]|tara:strand:+ start:4039 stop:5247 length:1209 start_codon:yes stop_codon:yes gene_type:complete